MFTDSVEEEVGKLKKLGERYVEKTAHTARKARCIVMERKFDEFVDPFPEEDVRWVVAQVDGARAFTVPYVSAQRYKDRLDRVFPGWKIHWETFDSEGLRCRLEIEGIVHEGMAQPEESDGLNNSFQADKAFIRACQRFGLGRYLQYLPCRWVDYDPVAHKVISSVPTLPAWALPGGKGYPTNVPGKLKNTQQREPVQAPAKLEKQGDHEIASEQALNAWEVLFSEARKAGLSEIEPVVPPITVGDLRKRYKGLKDQMG